MKKFAMFGGLVAVALLLGLAGTAVHPNKAQAKPTEVLIINPAVCIQLDPDYADAVHDCLPPSAGDPTAGLWDPSNLAELLNDLEADDAGGTTLADIADASGDQLNAYGVVWVVASVSNDENVSFDADSGIWLNTAPPFSSQWICTAGDDDCDNDGVRDDGMVVGLLSGFNPVTEETVADLGDWQLDVLQDGVDILHDYTVAGLPDHVDLTLVGGDTIQEAPEMLDCNDLNLAAFTDVIGLPQVTGVVAVVTDHDGTDLVGIPVVWDTSGTSDVLEVTAGTTITQVTAAGTLAPNFVCGDQPGTNQVEASVMTDPSFTEPWEQNWMDTDIDVTVIGEPDAMTITVSPNAVVCDGNATATVSAALVDSKGNKVVDGTRVRFDVVALGTANPITATTVDGVAKTTVKPLSGNSAGVVVDVLVSEVNFDGWDDECWEDEDCPGWPQQWVATTMEQSVRVDCLQPPPTVAPPPAGGQQPAVTPPRTGDGGYLP